MSIVLDEREYAEKLIANPTLGSKPSEDLARLAKYYKAAGYGNAAIEGLLSDYMIKCDPGINTFKWQDIISNSVKIANKFKMVELDSVKITQAELNICRALGGKQHQRLMFTLICLAKYANAVSDRNNNWVNKKDKEIFSMANIVTPIKRQSIMLGELRDIGLIRFSKRVDNVNISVRCVDDLGDAVMEITDFRNLGYQYERYLGGQFIECGNCGLIIKRSGHNHKYCSDCSMEVNRQRNRDNWKSVLLS